MRRDLALALFAPFVLLTCGRTPVADRGVSAIRKYGCGSCHTIPGISGAHGLVGPSLAGLGSRVYVAGALPNRLDTLAQWIQNPKAIHENTAMPVLGVTAREAADIAGYLSTLK